MTTHHAARGVRIWARSHTATEGKRLYVVRSGTWDEVTRYLRVVSQHTGPRDLYVECSATGKIRPLFA